MDWSIATRCTALVAIALQLVASAALASGQRLVRGYRIGRGDVVQVEVWREPDLSGTYTIDASGMLPHVLAGRVAAQGTTPAELAERLRAALERDYLREARVSVAVVQSARAKASVLGAVRNPGLYPLGEGTRLLELISAAGGTSEEAGARAMLLRFEGADPDGSRKSQPRLRIAVDLAALLHRGDLSQNPLVFPGDVIVVPSRESEVSAAPPRVGRVRVVGEVKRPGSYPLDEAGTVLDALLAAGGLSEFAAANRARLVRGEGKQRRETRIRLDDVMGGKVDVENPELRDGDILVVPESFF